MHSPVVQKPDNFMRAPEPHQSLEEIRALVRAARSSGTGPKAGPPMEFNEVRAGQALRMGWDGTGRDGVLRHCLCVHEEACCSAGVDGGPGLDAQRMCTWSPSITRSRPMVSGCPNCKAWIGIALPHLCLRANFVRLKGCGVGGRQLRHSFRC